MFNAKENLPPPLNQTTRNAAPGNLADPLVRLFVLFH